MVKPSLSLYFHIPFCSKKCPYCHFFVVTQKERYVERFLNALLLEWQQKKPLISNHLVKTLYFGGGTPTELSSSELYSLISTFTSAYPEAEEITVEANPETVTIEKMQALKKAGVNRISLGVQSLVDSELIVLKRQHHSNKALESIQIIREAGIENISIDLMYDLPSQTTSSFNKTLSLLSELSIEHLSLYNLVIEDGTAFKRKEKELKTKLPKDAESIEMLNSAIHALETIGLKRYEVSAFAKPGFESKHNLGYWMARPFLGLGPSAFSYYNHSRFQNVCNLEKYFQAVESGLDPKDFFETLEENRRLRELFVVRLRVFTPLSIQAFQAEHGFLEESFIHELNCLSKEGYLDFTEGSYLLNPKGALFYDEIASRLI
jgi:oxygen-independent coproporphyrinogen-3 oxidase